MDSKLFTLHTIETLWNKIKNKFYVKPANGIPKSDLDTTVQSSLSKADSALQEHQDISGKQDKSTAVTHSTNTAVGSATKPAYIATNGAATPISHSINSDVPANAKFTDTTYNDVTQTTHGLMTAADKKKLDGMDLTAYLPLHGTAEKAKELVSGAMRYGSCVNGTASFNDGYKWFRIGSMIPTSNGYDTEAMCLQVYQGYNTYGILGVYTRSDKTGLKSDNMNIRWFIRSSNALPSFKLVAIESSSGLTYELWCAVPQRYQQTHCTVMADILLTGGMANRWVMYNLTASDVKNAPSDGTKSVTDEDLSYAAKATEAATLTDSGWVNMTLESYSKSGTVKYRIYGKQITITGKVVLKNNVATSSHAPQAIASTTLDFSKIVGCSGVGRSSSGMGVYIETENFNGDNLVSVYALGGEIAAGATLYFTITGFID